MQPTPSASYSLTLRVKLSSRAGSLGELTMAIGRAGGDIGAIDIVSVGNDYIIRDVTVSSVSSKHGEQIVQAVKDVDGVELINVSDPAFLMHLGGKIEIVSKVPLKTRADLSMAYTPGVARICEAIHNDPEKAFTLTIKKNTVAIVTDGTAVLGLGDIGPAAAMPVMEGKAMLFKEFAGVDAFPICLDTKDPDEIVETVKRIAPGFGGINLEDISGPRCFEIENRLKAELDIPVFHDDQHGTAVVVLAALLNACKLTGRDLMDLNVLMVGLGAAGIAVTQILMNAGVRDIIGCDSQGAIHTDRADYLDGTMPAMKRRYAESTNPHRRDGDPNALLEGMDLFIGLSGPGVIRPESLDAMNKDALVFAMANPTPEVTPEDVGARGRVMATGRSDYPNQINNVLCFPGIFRGALAVLARTINEEMKLAAAHAIASIISDNELHPEYIIPSVFDKRVGEAVAHAVEEAAYQTHVARRDRAAQDEM